MKTIIASGLAGVIATALSMAAEPVTKDIDLKPASQDLPTSAQSNTALLTEISERITAKPEQAADVVKQAIIQTKANAEFVLQIVKTAVLAAPEQAEAIRKVALALAPDAEKEVEMVIAAVLQGDQVAGESTDVADEAPENERDASFEPEGSEPTKNTVWLTNHGAITDGRFDANSLPSRIQNTANSPNSNHNQGAIVRGGTTVIIRPTTSTAP